MKFIIVEYAHDPPITDAQLQDNTKSVGDCLENYRVRHVESFVSGDRRSGFCVYEAADAESVASTYHSAGVPFKRVWPADRFAS